MLWGLGFGFMLLSLFVVLQFFFDNLFVVDFFWVITDSHFANINSYKTVLQSNG